MSEIDSDFIDAVTALVRAGVEFIAVGVGGINFYARDPSEAVATRDLDLLLPPRLPVLRTALLALQGAGFSFEAGGEPFVDVSGDQVLEGVIRSRAALAARNRSGTTQLDLMLSMTGFDFESLSQDAVRFLVGGVEVRVGNLEKLLRSKELSGRPKDLEFLRMFRARHST